MDPIDARDFDGAAEEFEAALQIYPDYADALHGLGKARMALKQYDAAARALEALPRFLRACRDRGRGAPPARQSRARESAATLRRRLGRARGPAPTLLPPGDGGGPSASSEVLDIKQQIRTLQARTRAGARDRQPSPVPSFVSLALGSAYFRLDRLADAEREFRAALAADPKFGEAHSNLALVCLLTGRAAEAQDHVRLAEEAKFTGQPGAEAPDPRGAGRMILAWRMD